MNPRGTPATALIAAASALFILAGSASAADSSQRRGFDKCGYVGGGKTILVKAKRVSCSKARKVAKAFSESGPGRRKGYRCENGTCREIGGRGVVKLIEFPGGEGDAGRPAPYGSQQPRALDGPLKAWILRQLRSNYPDGGVNVGEPLFEATVATAVYKWVVLSHRGWAVRHRAFYAGFRAYQRRYPRNSNVARQEWLHSTELANVLDSAGLAEQALAFGRSSVILSVLGRSLDCYAGWTTLGLDGIPQSGFSAALDLTRQLLSSITNSNCRFPWAY